ncbi:hypothetical protein GLYMA_13G065451v4 [Glycine max]|nr:hypothetical protein GLYMA_13G065451v4 [Glycine max]
MCVVTFLVLLVSLCVCPNLTLEVAGSFLRTAW